MNFKQMLGLIVVSVGVIVMVFAFQHMGHMQEVNPGMITNSPLSPTERLPKTISVSKGMCWSIFIGGILLTILGSGMSIYYREDRD